MMWKAIGQSVIGTSHIQASKGCEDAICYETIHAENGDEVMIGFVSDGAGSATYAAMAAQLTVHKCTTQVAKWVADGLVIDEPRLYELVELVYDHLKKLAYEHHALVNEFSCTLLGFILLPDKACFMQIGDGAIVRNDGTGNFVPVWWPHNGEYQNSTAFVIDDVRLGNLKTMILHETVSEVAVFTDGLQMLALNNVTESVHQPFFTELFKWLRKATTGEHISILDDKLAAYLSGSAINNRTDDDKTLLLATKYNDDGPNI